MLLGAVPAGTDRASILPCQVTVVCASMTPPAPPWASAKTQWQTLLGPPQG